jgi:hypothetical protein
VTDPVSALFIRLSMSGCFLFSFDDIRQESSIFVNSLLQFMRIPCFLLGFLYQGKPSVCASAGAESRAPWRVPHNPPL